MLAIHQPLYLSRMSETGNPGAGKTHSALSPVVLAPSGSCNAAHAQPARQQDFAIFRAFCTCNIGANDVPCCALSG